MISAKPLIDAERVAQIVRGNAHELVFLLVKLAKLLAVAHDGVAGMLQFEVCADTGEQFRRIERLGHVIDRSHFEALGPNAPSRCWR